MRAGKLDWRAVTAGYAAGLVGLGALTLRAADEPLYDVDSAHLQRMKPAAARQHAGNVSPLVRTQPLPSAYSASTAIELRFGFEPVLPSSSDCAPLATDDEATAGWVAHNVARPRTVLHALSLAWCQALLGLSRYDAQAVLDEPRVHLLSTAQWRTVLREGGGGGGGGDAAATAAAGTALDVGAGSGHVTEAFAPLFREVFATEISPRLVQRLGARKLRALLSRGPPSEEALREADAPSRFDAVFLLNVLDRVPDAHAFLQSSASLVADGGVLVVALPLPYAAMPWERPGAADARAAVKATAAAADAAADTTVDGWAQRHGLRVRGGGGGGDGGGGGGGDVASTWEASAAEVAAELEACGLAVRRLVRAPYLCQGSSFVGPAELDVLDGAVFVCEVRAGACTPRVRRGTL